MTRVMKFDLFPASAFPPGMEELDLLAKLHWFRAGGESSAVQWRDIRGIVSARGATLDRGYLERSAAIIGVGALLHRAFSESQ